MMQYFINKENDAYFACLHTSNNGRFNTYIAKFYCSLHPDKKDIALVWVTQNMKKKRDLRYHYF